MTDKYANRHASFEIADKGDIELLDYALRNVGFGHVVRKRRLLNIKRWENQVFTFTRKGKVVSWQPFRAEFAHNAAGNCVVVCDQPVFYAQKMLEQAGFAPLTITKGEIAERPFQGSGTFTGSFNLNGRSLQVVIEVK